MERVVFHPDYTYSDFVGQILPKTDGEKINVCIGEKEEDPIFTISDLLPHLAGEQMERKLKEGIKGEDLNLLIGSMPYNDKEVSEKVKVDENTKVIYKISVELDELIIKYYKLRLYT